MLGGICNQQQLSKPQSWGVPFPVAGGTSQHLHSLTQKELKVEEVVLNPK